MLFGQIEKEWIRTIAIYPLPELPHRLPLLDDEEQVEKAWMLSKSGTKMEERERTH
ncbi:MAG TPA: hypothetical protein V6C57_24640 [Coleofasciculaceae cyanobacterium]